MPFTTARELANCIHLIAKANRHLWDEVEILAGSEPVTIDTDDGTTVTLSSRMVEIRSRSGEGLVAVR